MRRKCPTCPATAADGHLMCPSCWRLVPADLRGAVNRAWKAWLDNLRDRDRKVAYDHARDAAVDAVAASRSTR
jgi:hypothetical protein